jgi:hypothetical protein
LRVAPAHHHHEEKMMSNRRRKTIGQRKIREALERRLARGRARAEAQRLRDEARRLRMLAEVNATLGDLEDKRDA